MGSFCLTIFLKCSANWFRFIYSPRIHIYLYRQICVLSAPDDARKSVQIFMLHLELQTTHFLSNFLEILEKGISLDLDIIKDLI